MDDAAALFGTKLEIFNLEGLQSEEKRRNEHMIGDTQAGNQDGEDLKQEENKKTYTALLQNQLLRIDNPFLLREINDSEESHLKTNTYAQLQRTTSFQDSTNLHHPSTSQEQSTFFSPEQNNGL